MWFVFLSILHYIMQAGVENKGYFNTILLQSTQGYYIL